MRLLDLFSPLKTQSAEPQAAEPVYDHDANVPRAVVALGGGGARGIAHLGVMQAIGESGVQIERIVGVSMGGFVGAVCAIEPNIHRAQARVIELLSSPIFQAKQAMLSGAAPPGSNESDGGTFSWYARLKKVLSAHRQLTRAVTRSSLISDVPLRHAVEHMIPDIDIADLPLPVSILAMDLISGQRIVLEKGPLRLAVRASAAIPGIFPPIEWEDMLLCDLGVIESIPSLVAKSYATDWTIAVDVSQDHARVEVFESALDVMMRVDDICEHMTRRFAIEAADIVIRPDVGNVAWFDFREPKRLIEAGRQAGHAVLKNFANVHAA